MRDGHFNPDHLKKFSKITDFQQEIRNIFLDYN